jgi:hypothetical protein
MTGQSEKTTPTATPSPQPKPKPAPTPAPVEKQDQSEPEAQLEAAPEPQKKAEEEPAQAQEAVDEPKKPEAEATSPVPQGELSFDAIHKSWRKIKAMVGKHNPRTEGLLNTAKLTGLKDNALILGFTSETLQRMMEKEGNINLTADILEEVFGRPMAVKCIVTSHQSGGLPDNVVIEKDGMVGTATRDLGGEITDAKEAE